MDPDCDITMHESLRIQGSVLRDHNTRNPSCDITIHGRRNFYCEIIIHGSWMWYHNTSIINNTRIRIARSHMLLSHQLPFNYNSKRFSRRCRSKRGERRTKFRWDFLQWIVITKIFESSRKKISFTHWFRWCIWLPFFFCFRFFWCIVNQI